MQEKVHCWLKLDCSATNCSPAVSQDTLIYVESMLQLKCLYDVPK